MSMGYMPKKVKYAKRQQRLRKKYKNFSCQTCKYSSFCKHKISSTLIGVIVVKENIQFCPHWKAEKSKITGIETKKHTSFKKMFNNIFK